MRVKLIFNKKDASVNIPMPINNTHILKRYINDVLGNNNKYHGSKGVYSCSSMIGGKMNDNEELEFNDGSFIIVSSEDMEFMGHLMMGVSAKRDFGYNLRYHDFEPIEEKFLNGWNHFATLTPFIVNRQGEKTSTGQQRYATFKDADFCELFGNQLINKLHKIDSSLDLSDFKVHIHEHKSHKTKKVLIRTAKSDTEYADVINVANQCHVSIKCSARVANMLYHQGLGKSTNIGFGTIYKTENRSKYFKK